MQILPIQSKTFYIFYCYVNKILKFLTELAEIAHFFNTTTNICVQAMRS